ncbi:MAG: HK97 gp10 family phage protein [Lachnospiraceae bacterium]|nr:HK97 gp10 family phage protein [Lachnospiraceae bacterium]
MITFKQTGDFKKTFDFFKKLKELKDMKTFEYYGQKGVEALRSATPKDTGLTADSWSYQIFNSNDSVSLRFYNSNINQGVLIAVIIQYGHGLKNGGWVEGRDYINPAIQPVFESMAAELFRKVNT